MSQNRATQLVDLGPNANLFGVESGAHLSICFAQFFNKTESIIADLQKHNVEKMSMMPLPVTNNDKNEKFRMAVNYFMRVPADIANFSILYLDLS